MIPNFHAAADRARAPWHRCVVRILLAILLAAGGRAHAQTAPPIPDTPAGRALGELLRDYNTGRPASDRWARWYSIYGPVDVGIVEVSEPARIRAWVRGRLTRGWLGLDLEVDSANLSAEPGVTVFQLNGALPPELAAGFREPPRDTAQLRREIAAYLDALAGADFFSGVVLVVKDGEPFFSGAYGAASRRYGAPNALDTRFDLASLGKVFTAVAVLQLVQAGRVTLGDTVGTFLPDYPVAAVRGATVEQLLTHRSGIGRAAEDWIADRIDRGLDSLVAHTTAEPLFAPGTSMRYSNEGFLILGKIIEAASGQGYEAYLREHVFTPAGMTRTGLFAWDEERENVATPYTHFRFVAPGQQAFAAGERRNALMMHGMRGSPAGGAFSTAPDLAAFTRALLEHRLLDAEHLAAMTSPVVRQPPPFGSLGLGVAVGERAGGATFGHGGDAQGVSTSWTVLPSAGYAVIVLSNYDAIADLVATRILELAAP
jgi:D-alanyl-D-alanine carboxypeptidase